MGRLCKLRDKLRNLIYQPHLLLIGRTRFLKGLKKKKALKFCLSTKMDFMLCDILIFCVNSYFVLLSQTTKPCGSCSALTSFASCFIPECPGPPLSPQRRKCFPLHSCHPRPRPPRSQPNLHRRGQGRKTPVARTPPKVPVVTKAATETLPPPNTEKQRGKSQEAPQNTK